MDKIEELLIRGVEAIYPSKEELEKVLRSGKKLRLFQGFDPTGDKLHIGHMVGLRKLAQWQALGHHVIFLIGDGTGQAGDPSGKTKARDKFMTREELRQNARDYVSQAKKIVKFDGDNPVEILYNGDWLNKLGLVDILDIVGHFSLQQLAERDLFQERMKRGEPVNLREFIYPILQGYDSVAMQVDLELGGNDQTFNMLVGRTLVKGMLQKEKFVMSTPLLADATGRKIGKSEGNAIAIVDQPEELYRKIMGLGDEILVKGFECLTDLPKKEIKEMEEALQKGTNPMVYKKRLAFEIVRQVNDGDAATKAQEYFAKTVQEKEKPEEIATVELFAEDQTIADVLVSTGLAESKAQAKRLIEQGGVRIDEVPTKDSSQPFQELVKQKETLLQVGKRKYIKVAFKQ